jgi:hypothetical protein
MIAFDSDGAILKSSQASREIFYNFKTDKLLPVTCTDNVFCEYNMSVVSGEVLKRETFNF